MLANAPPWFKKTKRFISLFNCFNYDGLDREQETIPKQWPPPPHPQKKLEYVLYCRKTYASKIRNDDNETANSYTM